jgi:hypothetical protein
MAVAVDLEDLAGGTFTVLGGTRFEQLTPKVTLPPAATAAAKSDGEQDIRVVSAGAAGAPTVSPASMASTSVPPAVVDRALLAVRAAPVTGTNARARRECSR